LENKVNPTHDLAQKAAESLIGLADVTAIYTSGKEVLIKAQPVIRLTGLNTVIESRLAIFGFKIEILSTEPSLVVRMSSQEISQKNTKFPWLNLVMFFITILTTMMAGALMSGIDLISNPSLLLKNPSFVFLTGLPFSVSLLAILLCHEFGHYTAARIHRVNVTLPYFIPAPTIIGTFGAFIRSKSAFMNRKQLLDVAATGPLAGFVVAIVVLIIGISTSTVQPMPGGANTMFFGESLMYRLMAYLIKGPLPDGQTLMLSPIAFAGWVGLLVTMFNLLPIGQLDGGHIMYALFGKKQKILAYFTIIGLIALSFWWTGWAFWLVFTILLRPEHPPTLVDEIPIGRTRTIIGYLSIATFILCFMPVPIS
jgi:membrane-associated protease RseP (regulator of RpoE activity)